MSLFTESVVLVRRPAEVGRDSLGDPVYGEPTRETRAAWVDAPVVSVSSANDELTTLRETLNEDFTVYLDGVVDLEGVDRIEYRGETFEVEGEPARQAGGFVVGAYTMARMRRTEG